MKSRIEAAKINAVIDKCKCPCHDNPGSVTHFIECCRYVDMRKINLRDIDEPYRRPDPRTY